jgi:hypothetical protein
MNKSMYQVIYLWVLMFLNVTAVHASSEGLSGVIPVIPGTKFNYQGEVIYNGSPANGDFDVRFKLFNALTGGSELIASDQTITIVDGLMNAELDFGDAVFDGQPLWLEILIEQPTIPGFFILSPRVAINNAPYAIQSLFVANNGVESAAIVNGSITTVDIGNFQVTGTKIANNTISFDKFTANGANSGDVVQYNGSTWVPAPVVGGSSPWSINSNDISYSAGNVGIGTAAPATKLNIHGTESDELRLSGTNSTPSIHFRRNSNGADWYLKIDPASNQFHFQADAVTTDKIMTIKPDGEITRKKQTKTTYLSYKSFVPESNVYTYSTLNFLGMTGLHSTYSGGGPAKFHADVSLPADAVITQFEVMAGDNTPSGAVVAKLGLRLFGTSNGVITLSTLTSSNSPYAEVMSETLNTAVGDDRSYFVDVDIDNVTTPGQEVIFAGIRVTYETTTL